MTNKITSQDLQRVRAHVQTYAPTLGINRNDVCVRVSSSNSVAVRFARGWNPQNELKVQAGAVVTQLIKNMFSFNVDFLSMQ